MSGNINKDNSSKSRNLGDSIVKQPHNSIQNLDDDQSFSKTKEDKHRKSSSRHVSPFLFSKALSFSEQSAGANLDFSSPTYAHLQQQNANNTGLEKVPPSAKMQYNPTFLIQNPNLSANNSLSAQQQYMLGGSLSAQHNERIPTPLFSSTGNIPNLPLLTGSSNFSPMDMKNSLLVPNTSTFMDTYSANGKPNVALSPTMISRKNPMIKEEELEFEEYRRSQNKKDLVSLQKTSKKVEKKKRGKTSPSKRKNSKRKSISASGAIKPQVLEIDNSLFYNNSMPVSGIFNNLDSNVEGPIDLNTSDMGRTQQYFPPGSTADTNKYFFNENTNIVDLNSSMVKNRGSSAVYNFFASPMDTNTKNNEYDQSNFDNSAELAEINKKNDAGTSNKQKTKPKLELDDFKVDYEDVFINASQKYNKFAFNTNSFNHGTTHKLGSLSEHDLDPESDMNLINYLVLKEKTNDMHFNEQNLNKNKVTKRPLSAKKKHVNADTSFYLDIEALNKPHNRDVRVDVQHKQKVKRGRKPKPIKIIDQLQSNKVLKKTKINTGDNIAPQYINADVLTERDNMGLSESSKKVIDEIKQNALNGIGSKLVTFSPLIEFNDFQTHLNNSGATLPMSLSSARQFPKTSAYNFNGSSKNFSGQDNMYGALNTSEQMTNFKKISPFESINNTSSSSGTSTFNNSLKSYEQGMEKASANSDKSSNIRAALKNTMNAIKESSGKPKLKLINSSSSDIFSANYENKFTSSENKMGEYVIDDIMEDDYMHVEEDDNKDFASNDSIKAQFLNLKNENNKLIENFTLLNDEEVRNKNMVKISKKDKAHQKQKASLKKMLGNASSNIKQNSEDIEVNEASNNAGINDKSIVQALEKMFSDKPAKKKPMKKAQYINISTQVLKSTGNLLLKTSVVDRPPEAPKEDNEKDVEKNTEMATKNLNMTWLKNSNNNIIKLAHKSIVEALKKDSNFSEESLTKNKKGLFSCLHCELKFSTILDYAKHLDEVRVSGPYKCPFDDCCWKYLGMKTTQKLRRHCALQHISDLSDEMKSILNIKSDSYSEIDCLSEYCDKKFIRKDSIGRHQQMVHNNVNSRFNKKLERVQCFVNEHYSQLKEEEKKILVKQYMKGTLNLPASYRIKSKE